VTEISRFIQPLKYISANFTPTQIIVIGFALLILIGTMLLNLPIASRTEESIGFIDALFTATSATCVTGLIVVDTYTYWSLFGQIVIILLVQIGGLGFMTIAMLFSLILGRTISLKERLLVAESLNQYSLEGIVRLIKQILLGTLLFEGIGAIILSTQFIGEFGLVNGIYKGIFHAICAFCNAGFDLMGQREPFSSLTAYVHNSIVNFTIMALTIIGGLGFSVWVDIYKTRKIRNYKLHTKLVLTITAILIFGGAVLFFILEFNNPKTLKSLGLWNKMVASLFLSVSPRTVGFNTVPLPNLNNASNLLTMILIFIGGSPGSTAGGIKTVTVGVLILTVLAVCRGSKKVEVFDRTISLEVVLRAVAIIVISIIIVITATLILCIIEDASLAEILFEVVSSYGTSGLTLGITPSLTEAGKLVLVMTMFFGRVGVLTMALAFRFRMSKYNANYKYPEEKIMI
jgi:trk system potassium uptake protein TrkH